MRTARRAVVLAPLLLATVALAACTSSPSASTRANGRSTTTTSTTGSPARSTSSTTTTSSTPTSSTTTSTTTVATRTTCQPAQLRLAVSMGSGGAGTIEMLVTMVNTSSSTCTLDGYPGMQLLAASGAQIPTNVVRGGGPPFPTAAANAGPQLVSLATQQKAAFSFSYEDVPVGNETSCPTSAQAEVTPPNDTAFATVPMQVAPCNHGTVHVSPVYATG